MTWLFSFRRPQRFVTILASLIAAASASALASAQTSAESPKINEAEAETRVSSEQMTGRPDREVMLDRDVEIVRGKTTINADHATYWIEADEVEAEGRVRMTRFGDRYTGDKMRFKMDEGKGYVTNPTYHLQENNGQGHAQRIDFQSQDQARVTEGTYSTCEGPDPDWYLKANTMDLDKGREVGTTGTAVIYFKDTPILGTPYMSFPMSSARKSGFLAPSIGTTSTGGLQVSTPYYFNIAPNRDLTLTPDWIQRRGLMLGADGRYLGDNYSGETQVEYLNNDAQTNTNRYSLSSVHNQKLDANSSFGWNLNTASDNNYPSDFSQNLATSTQRLLLRDIYYNYSGNFWSATVRTSNYQVLQDVNAPIVPPYDRLPQVTLQAGRQDVNGFDWSSTVEATRFWSSGLVSGDRLVVNPSISYPIVHPDYFLTPKLSLNAASYNVQDPTTDATSHFSRAIPTFSLDGGLIFERETSLFGQTATQTLEPRLFYVRTPYRDQSLFPVFDSAVADLSFAQIFSENRFIGNDRISDADQLTAAVTSRYLEENGEERLRVALAERYYFATPQVTLNTPVSNGLPDYLASATLKVSNTLSTEGNLQYSGSQNGISIANYGVSWKPEPKKVLNVAYRIDVPNALRQVDVSGQWPLVDRWYGVGRINYSLPNNYTTLSSYSPTVAPPAEGLSEGLLGLEYKADCWVFRIVAQRIPTATGRSTSTLFFQLELNGLTSLGSSPMDALRTSIPGYQVINKPSSNVNY